MTNKPTRECPAAISKPTWHWFPLLGCVTTSTKPTINHYSGCKPRWFLTSFEDIMKHQRALGFGEAVARCVGFGGLTMELSGYRVKEPLQRLWGWWLLMHPFWMMPNFVWGGDFWEVALNFGNFWAAGLALCQLRGGVYVLSSAGPRPSLSGKSPSRDNHLENWGIVYCHVSF